MLCYLFSNNCIKFSALSAHFAISILHISHMASGDPFYSASTSNMLSYYHCYADHHSMFVNQKIFFFCRQPSDIGKTAVQYKSERRAAMEAEGFKILGNSGDQWSDLIGSPMATRSFKLPNPMYFIS